MSDRFHEGQFVRSLSLPEVKLTVLRRVSQRNAWACRIEDGFAVEFPEGDLVSYHISFPKRGRKS